MRQPQRRGRRAAPTAGRLVGDDAPQAPICRSILALLERWASLAPGVTFPERIPRLHLLVMANALAGTPDVPVD